MSGETQRFGIATWPSDNDAFTRDQMHSSHLLIDEKAAGFIQGGDIPAASSAYKGFFYYSSTNDSAGSLFYCNGVQWFAITLFDHGLLSGLTDDDHTQYLLVDGSRSASSLSVTGDITVGGRVSGRDIAADGFKLDGIEPRATADLSAPEILALLLQVDGPTSGLDADLLDGQQGSYYQPASTALKTSTQFGGDVSGTYNNIQVSDDSHNHVIPNIDGLQAALDSKQPLDPDLTAIANANNSSILILNTEPFTTELKAIIDGIGSPIPVGTVTLWSGGSAPDGWLVCDGSAVSRSTYGDLFSVIGVRYGSGDGSTTFNLPDTVSKVVAGLASGQSSVTGDSVASSLNSLSLNNQSATHNHQVSLSVGNTNTAHSHSVSVDNNNTSHGHNTSAQNSTHNHTYLYHDPGSAGNTTKNTGAQSANHAHSVYSNNTSHSHNAGSSTNTNATSHSHNISGSISNAVGSHNHTATSSDITTSAEFFLLIIKT